MHPVGPTALTGGLFKPISQGDFNVQKVNLADVVFIGDSITQYWAEEHPDFFNRNGFISRGICGDTSSDILKRFHADAVDTGTSVIVLLCGINDFVEYPNNAEEHVLQNILSMSEEAARNGQKLILCSLTPTHAIPWVQGIHHLAERIIELNLQIRAFAELRHHAFADYHKVLTTNDGGMQPEFTQDGCHPNSSGFTAMESVILRTVKSLGNPTDVSL